MHYIDHACRFCAAPDGLHEHGCPAGDTPGAAPIEYRPRRRMRREPRSAVRLRLVASNP